MRAAATRSVRASGREAANLRGRGGARAQRDRAQRVMICDRAESHRFIDGTVYQESFVNACGGGRRRRRRRRNVNGELLAAPPRSGAHHEAFIRGFSRQ